jgi:hypothetical protein
MDCSRRKFVRDGVLVAAGAAVWPGSSSLFAVPRPPWPIGCFNRPWTKWSFKETLAAIKSAGYTSMGLLTPTPRVVALPEIGG